MTEISVIEAVAGLRELYARRDWTALVQTIAECSDDDTKRVARGLLRKALADANDDEANAIIALLTPESLIALDINMGDVRALSEAMMNASDLGAVADLLEHTAALAPDDAAIAGLQVRLFGRLRKERAIYRLIAERPKAFADPLTLLNASAHVRLRRGEQERLIDFMEDTPAETPPAIRLRGVRWLYTIGEEERAERIARRFAGNDDKLQYGGIINMLQRAPQRASRLVPSERFPELLIGHSPGDRGAVIFFAGMGNRTPTGCDIIDRYLADIGLTMIVVPDSDLLMCLEGIAGVADTIEGAVAALRKLVSDLGIETLYTSGRSAGGFPAVVYGLELEAAAALVFGAPTDCGVGNRVVDSRSRVMLRRLVSRFDAATLDMVHWLDESACDLPITQYYAADNLVDAWHAQRIADRPNVRSVPIAGAKGHQAMIEAAREYDLREIFAGAFGSPPDAR